MTRVFCITQARLGSSRLPGKVLMAVQGKPLIYYHLQRVARASEITEHWCAISESATDDRLAAYLNEQHYRFQRGSEDDVLARFYKTLVAIDAQPDDIVVRLTGDCPLICPELIDLVITSHKLNNSSGYTHLSLAEYPRGFDVEVFNFSLLMRAYHEARPEAEREHVTQYLYNHGYFPILSVLGGSAEWCRFRLCVDEQQDLMLIEKLAADFGEKLINVTATELCNYLRQHPEIAEINAQVRQKH